MTENAAISFLENWINTIGKYYVCAFAQNTKILSCLERLESVRDAYTGYVPAMV